MNRFLRQIRIGFLIGTLPFAAFGAITPKPTLWGKFVATNIQGEVHYTTDNRILSLKKGDVLSAEGTVIETSGHGKAILLFSNQTSLLLDENTRLRIDKFEQEFFSRTDDAKTEPSKSATAIELLAGRVIVNAPSLHNGTSMVYRTSQADVSVLAERVAITATDQQTVVAVISGAAAVRNTQGSNTSLDTSVRLVTGQSIRVGNRRPSGSSPNGASAIQALAINPALQSTGPDEGSTALANAIRAALAADPDSAAAIAAKATAAAPNRAALIAFVAAKAAPGKAAGIAYAVTQAVANSNSSDRALRMRTASAIAAAAAAASPEQAAFVAASTVQALLETQGSAQSSDERIELTSTIASAVVAAVPSSASEVTSAALTALALAIPGSSGSNQQLVLAAARVVAAVAQVAPTESEGVGVAAVHWLIQNAPNLGEGALADAAGLIAAVAAQASPERASAINAGIASAANLSLFTLQASAARSTALASQINQQLGGILQNAAFAGQQAGGFDTNFGERPPAGAVVVNDAVFRPDSSNASATLANLPENAADQNPFSPTQIIPFDPALLGDLTNDLAATEAAPDQFVFDTGSAPDGTPAVQPVPTVPATLPVEFVTSPATG